MQLSLFERLEEWISPKLEKRARKGKAEGWEIIDHACRHCMGRIVAGRRDGAKVMHCVECGAEAYGEHDALCFCGVELHGTGRVFECFRNPDPKPNAPQQVLVRERSLEKS